MNKHTKTDEAGRERTKSNVFVAADDLSALSPELDMDVTFSTSSEQSEAEKTPSVLSEE